MSFACVRLYNIIIDFFFDVVINSAPKSDKIAWNKIRCRNRKTGFRVWWMMQTTWIPVIRDIQTIFFSSLQNCDDSTWKKIKKAIKIEYSSHLVLNIYLLGLKTKCESFVNEKVRGWFNHIIYKIFLLIQSNQNGINSIFLRGMFSS